MSAAGSGTGSARQTQAGRGPVLDAAQLEVLRRYGTEHDVGAGEVLFADGDLTYDLFVVLAGEVWLIERRGQPGETVTYTFTWTQVDDAGSQVPWPADYQIRGFMDSYEPVPEGLRTITIAP